MGINYELRITNYEKKGGTGLAGLKDGQDKKQRLESKSLDLALPSKTKVLDSNILILSPDPQHTPCPSQEGSLKVPSTEGI